MDKSLFDLGVPFAAGAVVALLAAYGTGAMTATNTAKAAVVNARIDERATMCQQAALAYLAQTGEQVPTGSKNSTTALAKKFLVSSGDVAKDRLVMEACSEKLSA